MAEIIYNVTTKVLHEVCGKWLSWMKEEHIPKMMATGCFYKAIILKLRDLDDNEGVNYAVQYHAHSEEDYEKYLADFANGFSTVALEHWGDKIVSFRTVLEIVN